jgi:hypothetical protein
MFHVFPFRFIVGLDRLADGMCPSDTVWQMMGLDQMPAKPRLAEMVVAAGV